MKAELSGRDYGILIRQRFLSLVKTLWGAYGSLNLFLYEFSNGKKVLTLFSSLNNNERWWYGVSDTYWINWDEKTSMALLMRWEENDCSFVILNPKTSKKLLAAIDPTSGQQKRINVRIPASGPIYIQEWPDLPLRIFPLEQIERPESMDAWKRGNSQDVPFKRINDPFLAIKKRLFLMSKAERQALLQELRDMN